MNPTRFLLSLLLLLAVALPRTASAQEDTTPASTPEEKEAFYTQTITHRAEDVLKLLDLKDAAKAARVRDLILVQYRSLRARDAAVSAKLKDSGTASEDSAARSALVRSLSQPLHEWFVGVLAVELTPEQVEVVKNYMTYNKVKVTFDAYCNIIPGLTDTDKAKIMTLLKAAREEAMDGGTAAEKSAVFQKFKDQINEYLNAHGHDVAKAYQVWEARQSAAQPAAAPAK